MRNAAPHGSGCKPVVYAEDVNYWRSGQSDPDRWLDRATDEIAEVGGHVLRLAAVTENDRAGFMVEFELDGNRFRLLWPVLQSKTGDVKSARRQAATALYHDVKARCLAVKFIGARAAFFAFLELADGRVAGQLAGDEMGKGLPALFASRALPEGKP